jgi:hypothetical protein
MGSELELAISAFVERLKRAFTAFLARLIIGLYTDFEFTLPSIPNIATARPDLRGI